MRPIDLTNVEEAKDGFDKLPAGGYVCKITMAQDMPESEMLKLEYDIAEGQYAGYFKKKYDDTTYWFGDTVKSYKETALPFFKQFITAVEKSNPGYHWNNNEQTLVGKFVGFVIGEEEYKNKKTGEVKTKMGVRMVRSVEAIRSGDFKIPELKKLKDKGTSNSNLYNMPANFTAGGVNAAQAMAGYQASQYQQNQNTAGDLGDFEQILGNDDLPF